MIITSYNIFQKVTFQEKDISNQYQRAYNADKYYLESNNQTIKKDDYEKVFADEHTLCFGFGWM